MQKKNPIIIALTRSNDIGPTPLGADISVSPYEWQKHDLEVMLIASREQGTMIIGSAGDTVQ